MNWLAQFVIKRTFLVWLLSGMLSVLIGWLGSQQILDTREKERLDYLRTKIGRHGIELLSQTLNGNRMGAIGLLGLIDANAKLEARNLREPNSKDAAMFMENIARAHDADGTYIVSQDGIIKSSWGVGKPLTGVDVKFRPYYKMAIKGKENVYAAIGTTTGRRNLYFAAPVFSENTKESPVIGAVVMRIGVVQLDKLLAETAETSLLLSPQKVVFASSHSEWIGHIAVKPTSEQIKEIRQLKQFGTLFDIKDPQPLPFAVKPGITTLNGVRHAVVQTLVEWNDPNGEWTLVGIENLSQLLPIAEQVRIILFIGLLFLILIKLMLTMLCNHYRQMLANQQLEFFAHAQEASAASKSHIAEATVRMQRANNLMTLIKIFLKEVHTLFGVLQGVVYLSEEGNDTRLRLIGHYACADPLPKTLAFGEGLLGQCAAERRPLRLDVAPDGFAMIRSGLGETRPSCLLLVPILLNENVLGVTEIALLRPLTEGEQTTFEELVRLLAMNIEIVSRSMHTEEMLSATRRAEQFNAEQLAFQQALVNTIPYPLFYKDASTRFLGVNKAYEEIFGIRREALVGKRVLDLDYLPEADRIAYQTEEEAILISGCTIKRELQIRCVNDKKYDTIYFVSGFQRSDGSPGGLVGTFIDITALKDAERGLDRLTDLERFYRLALGREQRVLELKNEVNALARVLGRASPYESATMIEPQAKVNAFDTTKSQDSNVENLSLAELAELVDLDDTKSQNSDVENLSLAELVDLDELQTLFSVFCESVGIAAAIIDLEAKILASARWQRACTAYHRVNPDSCALCIESDTQLALQLQDRQDFTIYTCKNGMTDCASPIIVEGQHLANVFIGQFHLGPPDMVFFRNQAQQFGYPEDDYLKAIAEVPVVEEKRLPALLAFLSGFARLISTMSLARRRADTAQAKLLQQTELLQRERIVALSLAEDANQTRIALEVISKESQI